MANGMQPREDAMLKQKFDHLANTNQSTGNPSCPEEVRRAKQIARQILNKAQAVALGGASDSENDEFGTEVTLTRHVTLSGCVALLACLAVVDYRKVYKNALFFQSTCDRQLCDHFRVR